MSIGYSCGLHETAKLSLEQIGAVLKATGISCVIERIDGEFRDVMLHDGKLSTVESDPGITTLYEALYKRMGTTRSDAASACELSTLIPGNTQQAFTISRRIDGVPDRYFKSLSVALAELESYADEHGVDLKSEIATLRRADELKVCVVFG